MGEIQMPQIAIYKRLLPYGEPTEHKKANFKLLSSEAMILAVMNAIFAIAYRSLKNSGPQRGLNP